MTGSRSLLSSKSADPTRKLNEVCNARHTPDLPNLDSVPFGGDMDNVRRVRSPIIPMPRMSCFASMLEPVFSLTSPLTPFTSGHKLRLTAVGLPLTRLVHNSLVSLTTNAWTHRLAAQARKGTSMVMMEDSIQVS